MGLLPVEDALARIVADVTPLAATEMVDLCDAAGRVLSAPLSARLTQPPFDASAMDGFAVRSADVAALPVTLRIVGEAAAGHKFDGIVEPGTAARIFTGAPVPSGADAIVIQENATIADGHVTVREGVPDAGHIRPRGRDFRDGDEMLADACRLSARHISLAAAMGHAKLNVRQRPRVSILATGDELVAPGEDVGEGQIVSSNPHGLSALAASAGAMPWQLGIARDSAGELEDAIDRSAKSDILVTIGGASVGDHDLVVPALRACGFEIDFWKIAMRPGKPLFFGRRGGQYVLGLPGNPVSSLICARVFLVPLIQALLGLNSDHAPLREAELVCDLGANGPRRHYMRAMTDQTDGARLRVNPVESQDSSLMVPLARADCLIVREPHANAANAGDIVRIMDIDF